MNTPVSALKVGCGKFFHGKNRIDLLPGEIRRLGGKALLIGGPGSVDKVMDALSGSLDVPDIQYDICRHTKQCTIPWAHTYANLALEQGYTVLVGIGGGKCIDEVKCASVFSNLPVITVPTSVATCVATSMVCIMYDDFGRRAPAVNMQKEVDVCIADEDLIASAPSRLLAAGILDSMAKYPESIHQKADASYDAMTLPEYIQIINFKGIYDFLLSYGEEVYHDEKKSPRFSDVILTNLLHTSIVSGFADGSGQLAIAHATYDFMRNFCTEPCADKLHGEIVAVGLIIQMTVNGSTEQEITAVTNLMKTFGMPLTLRELGFTPTGNAIAHLTEVLLKNSNLHTEEELTALRNGIQAAL